LGEFTVGQPQEPHYSVK